MLSIKSAFQELFKFIIICPFYKPRKIIFDHIPKCAGSSFTAYLSKNYLNKKTYNIEGRNVEKSIRIFKEMNINKRYDYDFINGHNAGKIIEFASPDCLKIIIFREPVQRIISHFYFVKSRTDHYLYKKVNSKNISIIEYVSENFGGEVNNYYVNYFKEISKEKINDNIDVIYNYIMSKYDYIFILEKFDNSVKFISKDINLFYKYKGKRLKVTKGKPFSNEIHPDVGNLIASKNLLDIQLYEKIRTKCLDSDFFLIKNISRPSFA